MTKTENGSNLEQTTPITDAQSVNNAGAPKKPKKSSSLKRFIKWVVLIAIVVGIISTSIMVYHLNQMVEKRFSGQLWKLPTVVYSRVLDLTPGAPVRYEDLLNELQVLGYQKVADPESSGEYTATPTTIDLVRRPFDFLDGMQPARHVIVTFDGDTIDSILDVKTNKQLGFLRIDPKMLGMLETKNEQQRVYVPLNQIPPFLIKALVNTEDRHFFEHDGIDVMSIGRAFLANLRAGHTVQGGSTLTQQLAKNMFLSNRRTLWRKVREAFIALIIDWRYSKDDILDAYMNQVYIGQAGARAVFGFDLGAHFYFGRPLSELTNAQLAMLAGMVRGPSYYNPWRYPDRIMFRRNLVLQMMNERGLLSDAAYQSEIKQPLGIQATPKLDTRQPAFFDLIKEEIQQDLGDKYKAGMGFRVFTTLDPLSQHMLDMAVRNEIPKLEKRAGKSLQTAAVVASRTTGQIQAMVGSSTPGYAGFNRAVDAYRQVGSVIKPAVYLTALDQPHRFQLATTLQDKPLSIQMPNGAVWSPRNYDRNYLGEVPLYQALVHSYNVPTVNLGMAVGLPSVLRTLGQLGLDTTNIPKVPSIYLGSLTLSPLQVTQMYQSIASLGHKVPLNGLVAVVNANNQVLYRSLPAASTVANTQAAWLTMYTMQKVVKQGTGHFLNRQFASLHLAGKTGTSEQGRDSWFVGIDGRQVMTVWVGRDDDKGTNLTGATGALQIVSDYIKRRDAEPLVLPPPPHIEYLNYSVNPNGTLTQSCGGTLKLPVWDPDGNMKLDCSAPKPLISLPSLTSSQDNQAQTEPAESTTTTTDKDTVVHKVQKQLKQGQKKVETFFNNLFNW